MLASILAGLGAGSMHVVSGPDHIAAVTPLMTRSPRWGWLVGVKWGIGHSGAVWFLTIVGLAFRGAIPVEAISGWSEQLVGFMLVAVGLWSLRRAMKTTLHAHAHDHDGSEHDHPHVHDGDAESHSHAPLGIGTLHGFAGTSHLVGILPALALPSTGVAVGYVLAYGLASIVAMGVVGVLVGILSGRCVSPRAFRMAGVGAAVLAIGVGCWWIWAGLFGHGA